jgi:hypothetical protein
MMKVRTAILTAACIGLLSTTSFGQGTPTDPMGGQGGTGSPTDPMGGQGGTGTDPMGGQGGIGSDPMGGQGGTGSPGMGSGSSGMGSESLSIKGEILRVQDDMYVVKDSSGREIALHVDQSTQKSEELKEGDQIKAEVTADGHALKVEKDEGSSLQ